MYEIRTDGNSYAVATAKTRKEAEKKLEYYKRALPNYRWDIFPEHITNYTKRKRRSG